MTEEERRKLLSEAGKRYEAAYGAERERFHREYQASQRRRDEIGKAYTVEIDEIGQRWAESHPDGSNGIIGANLAGDDHE